MTMLFALLARWGVPERFRKAAAWIMLAMALIALLSLAKAIYDHRVIAAHEAKQAARTSAAREVAAEEHAVDDARARQNERDLHNAIDRASPGDGRITPAAHALACERLRKIGRVPEACRHQGGDGAEAGSH